MAKTKEEILKHHIQIASIREESRPGLYDAMEEYADRRNNYPNDIEVAEWVSINIGMNNKCSASSAIYKFRLWLRDRQSPSVEGQAEAAAGWLKELIDIRNKLYQDMPVGTLDPYELVTYIKWHINDLDNFCSRWKAGQTGDAVEFAEWISLNYYSFHKNEYTLNGETKNDSGWSQVGSYSIPLVTTQQLYSLFKQRDQCPEINHDPVVVNEIEETADSMRVQQAKERVYWQKRCEAAEKYIHAYQETESCITEYNEWQELKNKEVK